MNLFKALAALTGSVILFLNAGNAVAQVNTISEAACKAMLRPGQVDQATAVLNNYDVKYCRLQFKVDPAVNYITGAVTSYFQPTVMNFTEVDCDLSIHLNVDSVIYHGAPLSFVQLSGDV